VRGLGDSGIPCARVLSVSELLAIMGGFLPGRRFILRLKKASVLRAEAFTFDVPNRTAFSLELLTLGWSSSGVHTGCVRAGTPIRVYWEAYIPGG